MCFRPTIKTEKNKSNLGFTATNAIILLRLLNGGLLVISISAARPGHCSSWFRITYVCVSAFEGLESAYPRRVKTIKSE